jgi:hypothetical protein
MSAKDLPRAVYTISENALEGKRAEIRAVYEHFFDLWKVTDANVRYS